MQPETVERLLLPPHHFYKRILIKASDVMNNEFIEVPASKQSTGKRKLIFGVGINDADYITNPKINGKTVVCPYYQVWHSMIRRCNSKVYQAQKPTYIGCSVSSEWLRFTTFKSWMITKDWQGKHLDKDFKVKGNKVYAPANCLFISGNLNSLLVVNMPKVASLPAGVTVGKGGVNFVARISIMNVRKYLGSFISPEEAENAYITAKNLEIVRQSNLPENSQIKQYFSQYIKEVV